MREPTRIYQLEGYTCMEDDVYAKPRKLGRWPFESVALVLYYGPESPRFWSGDWVAFCEFPIKLPPWLEK